MISGSASGVSTLADGSYSIQVAPGTTLTFQYIGYKAVEYTVPDGRTQVTCNLEMQSDTQALEDVVVIAYGVRKKGTIAGSVSTVKAEKIETTPTAAFDQALQGQVPGLTVLSSSGEPSKSAELTIRGTNSINAGTDPLFVLDGIVISASDFNAINPADIESLSVLKDASSTSIYGARAANGVVVITTKRGRMADRPVINYRMQLGISQLAHGNWDLMNTAERIQYEKEIGLTEGKNYSLLSQTDVNWLTRFSATTPCSRTTNSRSREPPKRRTTTFREATTTRKASPPVRTSTAIRSAPTSNSAPPSGSRWGPTPCSTTSRSNWRSRANTRS